MDFIKKLRTADYISLTGLFFAWFSIIFILKGEANAAIMINIFAFICDLLDGYTARKLKQSSIVGRHIDSMIDVFIYVVFSALFYFKFLSANWVGGIIGGFFIIIFGVLRLIRFNTEGILNDKKGNYYRGVTVVHMNALILLCYFCSVFIPTYTAWITDFLIIGISPLMLSDFRSYKGNSLYYAAFGLLIFIVCMLIQYGYFK
jgi:CDP-diacylglycerol--serine O-phosphatidyltransferase